MFKIHLPQNKETAIAVTIFVGLLLLVVTNVLVIVVHVITVYGAAPNALPTRTIDTATVNKAIENLTQP